jgi:hypothetical protein
MKLPLLENSAALSLVAAAFLCVGCAAAAERSATRAAESAVGIVKSSITKLGPLLRKGGEAANEAVERQMASWALKGEQRAVFKTFESARLRVRWRVAKRDVKSFVREFEAGAREPERYFADPSANPLLVARWKATPKSDRVFVAATEKDTAVVDSLRVELERQGKTVFFYRFCAQAPGVLCDSRTVGAFFGTAGTAVLAVTEATGSSRFLSHEVAAATRLATGQSELLIFTPVEAVFNAAEVRVVDATVDRSVDANMGQSQTPR